MKTLVRFGLLLLFAAPATASQPTTNTFGAWHVISIASMSGTEGDDPSALISQEIEGGELSVVWSGRERIIVSVNVDDCYAEDQDFKQFYIVPIDQWLTMSQDEAANRLAKDFSTWISQALLSCRRPNTIGQFRLAEIKPAARDFMRRLHRPYPQRSNR